MSELNDCFKEAVCVDVQRIFDSCSDRDCIYDLPITLTQDSAPITDEMDIVRTRCAEVEVTCISVDPVPFKNGFYAVDITYRFKITAEAFTQGFCKNQAGTILCGTALWNKRVILYGSEGTSKIFTSDQDLFPTDVECNECTCCNDAASMPKATVRVLDPIALDTKLACKKPYPPHCCQPCEEDPKPCVRVLTVSLGLFSIIQLSRPVSIIVPAYDYCIPCKDCSLTDTGESPCDVFDKLEFPSEQFFPQPSSDATKYGCCDKNEKKKCDCDSD